MKNEIPEKCPECNGRSFDVEGKVFTCRNCRMQIPKPEKKHFVLQPRNSTIGGRRPMGN